MGPEKKLWRELKNVTPEIKWTRIENTGALGTPDLLGYNKNLLFQEFITLIEDMKRLKSSCLI